MGKQDSLQRIFWEDNVRFADLFNTVLGQGEFLIQPEDIEEKETGLVGIKEKLSTVFQRDVIRKVTKDMTCFLVGIENQTRVHYAMPARVMLWDALVYAKQIRMLERLHRQNSDLKTKDEFLSGIQKGERLKPICTIVLYYGEKVWDGPRELHDILELANIPKKLQGFFANYPMILIDMHRFSEWERFQSDLREVFGFVNNSQNMDDMKKFLAENAERMSSISEDACALIESVTGTKKIRKFRKEKKEEEENMCKAIDDMLKESWEKGFEECRKKTESEKKKVEAEKQKAEAEKQKAEAEKKKVLERVRYLEKEVKRLRKAM